MSSPIANWIVAACNFAASSSCFFFLTAILTTKTTRRNAFNIYVTFMLLPDALLTLVTFAYNVSRALAVPMTPPMEVFAFVNFLYFGVNFNANAVVTYEINKLITQSNRRQRTSPPDLRRVYKQMFCVYLLAILVALWGALPVSWSLYHVTDHFEGVGALGSPPGGPFTFVAATGISYALLVIPALVYVICISIRVWAKKLLPRKGRTRMLSVFFMRVVFVFILFYIPSTALAAFVNRLENGTTMSWLKAIRGLLTAAQASTTLYLVSVKDDIRKVVIDKYNCTIGRLCCKISSTTRKRESNDVHVSGSFQVSGNVRISGINPNSTASHSGLWPSIASKSFSQSERSQENKSLQLNETSQEQCPQQSEWEAEDEYDDANNDTKVRTADAEKGIAEGKGDGNGESIGDGKASRYRTVNMAGELETKEGDNTV